MDIKWLRTKLIPSIMLAVSLFTSVAANAAIVSDRITGKKCTI